MMLACIGFRIDLVFSPPEVQDMLNPRQPPKPSQLGYSDMPSINQRKRIVLGRISGVYGVRGWLRIFSETVPIDNILSYSPWLLNDEPYTVAEGRKHGKGLVVRLAGHGDRDQAAALVGQRILVYRDQLPPPRPDEFYWADLEGLRVETLDKTLLGRVSHLFDTGANDVLVVIGERERLVPFLWDSVVKDVDFDAGRIQVDWDPEF